MDEGYLPLIIYSPEIKQNTRIEDVCYQSDIYPTMMSLLGAEKYYWQGLGVNILDSAARQNRLAAENELFDLSDRVIMNDWFGRASSPRE